MGIQDRDYYREHHAQKREDSNEAYFSAGPSNRAWVARLAVLALVCACVYLIVQVVQLRRELATADRVIHQMTGQLRADRERFERAQRATQRSAPVPPPVPGPAVEFFNK